MTELTIKIPGDHDVRIVPGDEVSFSNGDLVVYLTGKDVQLWRLLTEIRQDGVNRVIKFYAPTVTKPDREAKAVHLIDDIRRLIAGFDGSER